MFIGFKSNDYFAVACGHEQARRRWHPVDLSLKLALAPYAWSDPVLEWYTPPSDFSHGTYFGMARCGDAGDRRGYLATQDFHGEFRECEFPLEELEALRARHGVVEDTLVEEHQGIHGLVLGGGSDVSIDRQGRSERLDLGFDGEEVCARPHAVETNESYDPLRIVVQTEHLSYDHRGVWVARSSRQAYDSLVLVA